MKELSETVRDFLARANEPVAPADFEIAQRMSAAFWFIGAAVAAALLPFDPPIEAFGVGGWGVTGAGLAVAVAIGWWRLRKEEPATLNELFASSVLAVLLIGALEWMAGGRDSPYHFLYWLPVLYAAAAHRPSRVIPFLLGVSLVAAAPLAYEGYSSENALETIAQLLMFYTVGAAVWVMFVVLREQRAEIRTRRATAEAMALEDGLTGLGNRRAFDTAIHSEIARSERSGEPFSVLIADLDGFKQINDRLGHLAGDDVLKRVSRRMRSACRDGDACFRWGGDEFAVVLPGAEAPHASRVAERISRSIAGVATDDGHQLSVTCGSAQWRPGMGAEELTHDADNHLFGLKERHRAGSPDGARIDGRTS